MLVALTLHFGDLWNIDRGCFIAVTLSACDYALIKRIVSTKAIWDAMIEIKSISKIGVASNSVRKSVSGARSFALAA